VKIWTRLIWLRTGSSGRLCEHGIEHSGSIESGKVLGKLSDYQILKDSALWSWLWRLLDSSDLG
jgi:hypothetical protein